MGGVCATCATGLEARKQNIVVVQYNMLMNDLSSNAIPWLMMLPEELKMRCKSWKETYNTLFKEYKKHWHKNSNAGDFLAFRSLWGEDVASQEMLSGARYTKVKARFVSSNIMRYPAPCAEDICREVSCKTLLGILLEKCRDKDCADDDEKGHEKLAREIFNHIFAANQDIFNWEKRGLEIFKLVTNAPEAETEKVSKRFFGPAGCSPGESPDIVVICEYDVNKTNVACPELEYIPGQPKMSFPQAMNACGYSHVFFGSPPETWGLAVFLKVSTFRLVERGPLATATSSLVARNIAVDAKMPHALPSDVEQKFRVKSVDMQEHSHKRAQDIDDPPTILGKLDRRCVGLVALEFQPPHAAAGKQLVVVTSHLMAKNRDSAGLVHYPGEVRAQELETISRECSEFVEEGEAVVFFGDYNINVADKEELYILNGSIPAVGQTGPNAKKLSINTGYKEQKFHWSRADQSALILADAHKDQNLMSKDADDNVVGTTHNVDRLETTDYIFYDDGALDCVSSSLLQGVAEPMPNKLNPSDHIPLVANLRVKPTFCT